jgi:RecA-family ATPase
LLARSERQAADSAQRQLWGLHVRTGAVTLFIGETSVAKTVFLHNLAYHLATGQQFLGITPPRPLGVLYVDFESYDDIFAEHLSAIGTPDGWRFVEQDHLGEPGAALKRKLATSVRSNEYDVVIIDPLMEAYPVKDENDNALANVQMAAFRKLA